MEKKYKKLYIILLINAFLILILDFIDIDIQNGILLSILSILLMFWTFIPIMLLLHLKSKDSNVTPKKRIFLKAVLYALIFMTVGAATTEILSLFNIQ